MLLPSTQVVRGFLLARDNMAAITSLVSAMADSGLPCYKFPDTLKNVSDPGTMARYATSAVFPDFSPVCVYALGS